ncbi:MAG: small ribosomal subunit Rsm22 family protein [Opitutaceae bacterium]|jgi:hypothetical protein
MTLKDLDWRALDRLRDGFLNGTAAQGPYWRSPADLAAYDLTYGERIGWKWDAVLHELRLRGWTPPGQAGETARGEPIQATGSEFGTVLDWGCGSGVAGRRVLSFFGAEKFSSLRLHDHSSEAVEFAAQAARTAFPHLAVSRWRPENEPIGLLVLSHVLNELSPEVRTDLLGLARRSAAVLWIEPGTHADSRALQQIREELRGELHVVAPCTHRTACGLLASGRENDWCHHFAPPAPEAFTDGNWVKFGQRAGIDLRSVPYSFLALDRHTPPAEGLSRIIGRPKYFKGYVRFLNCDATGIADLMLQKRDDPALFKQLDRERGPLLYRWRRGEKRVVGGESLGSLEQERIPSNRDQVPSDKTAGQKP